MFRGDPRAVAADARARQDLGYTLSWRLDRRLAPVERRLLCLPFRPSGDIEDQALVHGHEGVAFVRRSFLRPHIGWLRSIFQGDK